MTDAAFWTKLAPRYAARPIDDMQAYLETLKVTAGYLSPEDHLLEVGCGTGGTALRLAPHVAQVTATDISDGMIAIAQAKLTGDAPRNVAFHVAQADDVPGDAPFDVICAFNLLHLVPDPQATVNALTRHLRPGGLIITKTPCIGEMGWYIRPVIRVMRAVGKAPFVVPLTRSQLLGVFDRAGLETVETRTFGKAKTSPFIVARRS